MLKAEQFGQFIHVRFDQFLEAEHDPCAALRVERGPGGLRGLGVGNSLVEMGRIGEFYPRLNLTGRRVVDIAGACTGLGGIRPGDEMGDGTHWLETPSPLAE